MNEIAPGYRLGGFWKARRVLVTGASGFIGASLVAELLSLGAEVKGLDVRQPIVTEYLADLSDFDATLRAVLDCQPEIVFHLAAASQVTATASAPALAVRDNTVATANILEAVRRYDGAGNVVVASSDKAYGPQPQTRLAEDSPLKPVHIYDTTKAAADLLAQCYGEFYHLPVAITRMANVYGPGDMNSRRLVPSVLAAWLRGHEPVLRSDGNQIREFLYIGDAILGLLAVGKHRIEAPGAPKARVFNLGSPFRYSANALIPVLRAAFRSILPGAACKDPIILGGAQDETTAILLNSSEIYARLGWEAKTGPLVGIVQTTQWLAQWMNIAIHEPEGL